jgi:hypothetical protein
MLLNAEFIFLRIDIRSNMWWPSPPISSSSPTARPIIHARYNSSAVVSSSSPSSSSSSRTSRHARSSSSPHHPGHRATNGATSEDTSYARDLAKDALKDLVVDVGLVALQVYMWISIETPLDYMATNTCLGSEMNQTVAASVSSHVPEPDQSIMEAAKVDATNYTSISQILWFIPIGLRR